MTEELLMNKAVRWTLMIVLLGVWSSQLSAATPQAASPAAAKTPTPAPAPAAPVASTVEPHWHTVQGDWVDAFHRPFDGLEMGLDVRLRNEYYHNSRLDDNYGDDATSNTNTVKEIKPGNWNEENAQRYRTRWWMAWKLAPDVTFNTRLVWEFWTFDTARANSKLRGQQDTDFREMIFDQFNIQWKNAFEAPMTLTVGRQDIKLGTGWLIGDGTYADGSRTAFFDAVRATIDLRDTTQLDLIGIVQHDDEEEWLPVINHRDYLNLTQSTDETGFIAYLTDKTFADTTLEAYYIYKKEEDSNYRKYWRNRSEFWSSPTAGQDSEIHTIGGRIAQNLDENWSYSVEVAKQFGSRNVESMKGLGVNDKLAYAFNDELKNELRLTHEYMSGDDPDSRGSEAFDTLWGDWPQPQRGGDLIWNIMSPEAGAVTNIHRVGVGHTFKPIKNWSFATDYNLFWADENTNKNATKPADGLAYSRSGNFRGQMLSWLATYSCCKNFKTYFMLDYFVPGSYYDQSSRDHAVFARINMEWTF
jgi:hypothetical protein